MAWAWELWWLWVGILLLGLALAASQWPYIVLPLMFLAAITSTVYRTGGRNGMGL